MSEPRSRTARKDASRTVAIVAVVVLIAIAVAGIMLAGRPGAEAPVAVAPTASAAAASTPAAAASSTAEAPTPPTIGPDEVLFAAGSSKLPLEAAQKIAVFADFARAANKEITIRARYTNGKNRQRELDLAKARQEALRHAFQANGFTMGQIMLQTIETSEGNHSTGDLNMVQLSTR